MQVQINRKFQPLPIFLLYSAGVVPVSLLNKYYNIFFFLLGRSVFRGKLGSRNPHIFLELSAEKADVGKITKLGNLCYGVPFKAKQVTGVIEL